MVLVDTSVLINFLKGKNNPQVDKLSDIIKRKIPFGICSFVYMEILQGARNEKEHGLLKNYFSTQKFYELQNGITSIEAASLNYYTCRKNGITIRSTIDILVAQIAIENNLFLLHDDNDFTELIKVTNSLKEY